MFLHCYQRVCHRIGYDDKDAGFTLIEVVTSLAILAIVSVSVIGAIIAGINASGSTGNRVGAANIAQSDLEQARAQPTPSPTVYATAPASNGGTGGSYRVTRTVTMPSPTSCPVGNDMIVKVVVSGPGVSKSTVTMSTVLACGNP